MYAHGVLPLRTKGGNRGWGRGIRGSGPETSSPVGEEDGGETGVFQDRGELVEPGNLYLV